MEVLGRAARWLEDEPSSLAPVVPAATDAPDSRTNGAGGPGQPWWRSTGEAMTNATSFGGLRPAEASLWGCSLGSALQRDGDGSAAEEDGGGAAPLSGGTGDGGTGAGDDAGLGQAGVADGGGTGGVAAPVHVAAWASQGPPAPLVQIPNAGGGLAGGLSPMAVDAPASSPRPPPVLPVSQTQQQAGPSEATSPGAEPPRPAKAGSGGTAKSKGKKKGRGKESIMDLDLPDLDSEPDLSEPEPDPEAEAEEEDDGEEVEEEDEPPPPPVAHSAPLTTTGPATAAVGLATVFGDLARSMSNADGAVSGGGDTTYGAGVGASRNASEMYGNGSGGGDDDDADAGAVGRLSSDDDGEMEQRTHGLTPGGQHRRRKPRKPVSASKAAAADGPGAAAAGGASQPSAADLDVPSLWDDGEYIYKDVDPNDLDIGIEFPQMEFKPEDLELPPDEFSGEEEGEVVIGEDGKPVRRMRLSAAALAEGEAFIGLEGLVSWGREGTYRGTITRFDPYRTRLMWLMSYEDGDEEWGAVTEDRNGWRVHGGLRPVAWIGQPPPATDPLSMAAAAADAIPGPVAAQKAAPVQQQQAQGFIVNLMNAEIEVAVGRDGQTRFGTIVDFDSNRPRYKWFIRYVGYAEPAYGGTGEWGCLDEEKTTWHTHGYKRPVLAVTGGVGGLLPVAPPKPTAAAAAAAAQGFTPRKGPFGRTGLGLMYLLAASEPAPDGKFQLPVMALGAVRGAYGSAAGLAAAAGGGKAALGLTPAGKPERVSSQAMAGVPDEYGATLVGAKITITVGRGQGHKRTGTITEYDANRPKYRWRLTFDTIGEPAHGGAAEWGMLSDDQSLWLAHGYKRNITALAGVPERKARPAEQPPSLALQPAPSLSPLPSGGSRQLGLLAAPSPAAAAAGSDAMVVDGGAAASPDAGGAEDGDRRQRSETEGPEVSPGAGGGGGDVVKKEDQAGVAAGGEEGIDAQMDAALAAAAAAAVAILYGGNMEVAAEMGIDPAAFSLGEVEELGTNLVGAKLLVAVGRGGARRSGTITDYEPNRPRYKWRLVYDAEVMPVGVTSAAAPTAAEGGADAGAPAPFEAAADAANGSGAAAAGTADATAAADGGAAGTAGSGSGAAAAADANGAAAAAAAPPVAAEAGGSATAAADPSAAGVVAAAPAPAAEAGAGAPVTASTVVEGEWGTLSDDRTAWLCHGYRRAILASEGVPALPPAYITAAAAAAAAVAAQSPQRKRRPNLIDEQSVASALLTLGKRARREAKAAAVAAREARQAEIAAAGGHVILIQPTPQAAPGAAGANGEANGVVAPSAVPVGAAGAEGTPAPGAVNGTDGATGGADGGAGGPDGPVAKRIKVEPGVDGEAALPGVTYVRQPVAVLGLPYGVGSAGGEGAAGEGVEAAANVGPVSPVANPEGVVGLEIEVERGTDGRQRGRVLSYDAKKPRLRWLVRYHDGNQEWGTFADDLSTLRVYGAVRPITWTSRPPAVLPKGSKARRSSAARASPAAPGTGSAAGTPIAGGGTSAAAGGLVGAAAGGGAVGNGGAGGGAGGGNGAGGGGGSAARASGRRSSENGDSDWVGGPPSGYGSAGTDYRYIFRRNGMCRAQITHQGCAIISPYYDTPEAAAAAADYYNYKLRGTAAHLNLGLTAEQRVVLDQLTLEQLQAYIKGRGDIHDLSKALLQFAGPAGIQLHQQLQMMRQLELQQQQMLQMQQQQQIQQQEQTEEQQAQLQPGAPDEGLAQHEERHQPHQHTQQLPQMVQYQEQLRLLRQQQHQHTQRHPSVGELEAADSRAASAEPQDNLGPESQAMDTEGEDAPAEEYDDDDGELGGRPLQQGGLQDGWPQRAVPGALRGDPRGLSETAPGIVVDVVMGEAGSREPLAHMHHGLGQQGMGL